MDCLVLLHYSELLLNVLGKRDYESNLHSKTPIILELMRCHGRWQPYLHVLLSWSFVHYTQEKYINHSKYYNDALLPRGFQGKINY